MRVGGFLGIRTPCLAWGLVGLASRLNPHRACLCAHETILILILILSDILAIVRRDLGLPPVGDPSLCESGKQPRPVQTVYERGTQVALRIRLAQLLSGSTTRVRVGHVPRDLGVPARTSATEM